MNGTAEAGLYLDASVVILLIEGRSEVQDRTRAALKALGGEDCLFMVPPLTKLECLVKPLRTADRQILEAYQMFFSSLEIRVLGMGSDVWERATHIRAKYGLAVPDALHLATATVHGCARIVTRDVSWKRFVEAQVEVI